MKTLHGLISLVAIGAIVIAQCACTESTPVAQTQVPNLAKGLTATFARLPTGTVSAFTSSPEEARTETSLPTAVPAATATSLSTSLPTDTKTHLPTSTPMPTETPSPLPTASDTPTPSPTPLPPPIIILMVVDSMRADHVSAYGYDRDTTPNLDALVADQGVRFHYAITTSPWTCPSNASLLTGRTPTAVGATWDTIQNTLPGDENTLGEYLQQGGYYTAAFVNCYCLKGKLGFSQGFDHFDEVLSDRPGYDKARAAEVNARVVDWLKDNWLTESTRSQPLFLFIYYFDPHVWYDPPPPYDTLYDADYAGTFDGRVYKDGRDVVDGNIVPSQQDREHIVALYDGEITYWDAEFGQLMEFFKGAGILDEALIIVTADHGELFGEHGEWTHGNALYEEVIRVPLVMRYPGVIASGTVIGVPVQHMDLMPTILDFAGLPVPAGLQSISLRRFTNDEVAAVARDIYSELDGITDPSSQFFWLAPRVDLRSTRRGEWKLIHHVGDQGADELFELKASPPYERDNLALLESDRAQEMRETLIDWFGLPGNN